MRPLPEPMIEALGGSVVGASLKCYAWYDGQLMNDGEPLPVGTWSMEWSRDESVMVQGQARFTVNDAAGDLAPWGFDEALSVGGSRIQVVLELAGEAVDLGWWVVSRNQPNEAWRLVADGLVWVPGGATVPVEADDLTLLLADDRFMSPEAPADGGTVFSELRRLCGSTLEVVFTGVEDKPVPLGMVYHEERINTIYDLARLVGDLRMTGDGLLEVYNPARTAPAWRIFPSQDGSLVQVNRSQARDELFNAVVATGQNLSNEIREYATLAAGPLRFDGPLGRKPRFVTSVKTDRSGVLADAQAALTQYGTAATTKLEVHALPHPGMQIGDWVEVSQPVIDGQVFPLVGQVQRMTLSGSHAGFDLMALDVECSTADVQKIAAYVRRV